MRAWYRAATVPVKRKFDPRNPELMDRPQPVSAELERDLQNLCRLNRLFGSHRLVRHFIRRSIEPGSEMRILDLATGFGDIPRLVVDWARSVGARVGVDAIERNAATLQIARRFSTSYPEISFIEGNVLDWSTTQSYDVVLCSLALHHFSDKDAVQLLGRCRDLGRRLVLVSDLRRGYLATVGVFLLTATFFREPMTRTDGRLSAARAFSGRELRSLAERAGWKGFQYRRFRWARQAIWIEPAV